MEKGMGSFYPLHNGEFFIYWEIPIGVFFMVKTKDPLRMGKAGLVKARKGMIDPTPLWDEMEKCI